MAQSQLRHFLFPNLHVAALVTASHGWRGIAPVHGKKALALSPVPLLVVRGARLGPTWAGLGHSYRAQPGKFPRYEV